ncbi:MAG: hypothetical protein WA667_00600 [Candidatus Nitrosopolaris sp.]
MRKQIWKKFSLTQQPIRIAEDIKYYRQLGELKQEQNKISQQIDMLNAFMANKQQVIMALFRLQSIGINEDLILNMAQQMNNGQQYIRQ